MAEVCTAHAAAAAAAAAPGDVRVAVTLHQPGTPSYALHLNMEGRKDDKAVLKERIAM